MATKKAEPVRVPVSKRALIQRINRKLAADMQVLKTCRGARAQLDLGDYYILDGSLNVPSDTHVDIEELGRDMGCLSSWEKLQE